MDVELRHLRCLVAIVEAGSFTDAAIDLGMSQAAVSRTLASLERTLGVRLLHRTSRSVAMTPAGTQLVGRARHLLDELDDIVREARSGHSRFRLGHAWSALGRHTTAFQRQWAKLHPEIELVLVRTNTPSGGLAEGACDLAVVRTAVDEKHFASMVVGVERRHVVIAADDAWARRRSIKLDEVRDRVVLVDRRTGTTSPELWPTGSQPRLEYTADVDDWLALIAAGGHVGITPESTATQYARAGVVFRPLQGAPPVPVRVIWPRQDPHPSTQAAVALITEVYRA
ncbi:DNA-binding transcriptional LysR family regulator [Kribbella amoyensis]|uniref:DNA-binding transcriptional LysR family regulator n=1 Tax=Kribbella amoyensis TaxID=996641 RepID=A0A561BRZ7_9ACTN|nr:LysR family transcriptional regulator [Kribbella amoyensis]TWD81636.1 DNA-binding transcriptional LysR family regulator [Kribbella amoyensis]